jgi:hypothetical protein
LHGPQIVAPCIVTRQLAQKASPQSSHVAVCGLSGWLKQKLGSRRSPRRRSRVSWGRVGGYDEGMSNVSGASVGVAGGLPGDELPGDELPGGV